MHYYSFCFFLFYFLFFFILVVVCNYWFYVRKTDTLFLYCLVYLLFFNVSFNFAQGLFSLIVIKFDVWFSRREDLIVLTSPPEIKTLIISCNQHRLVGITETLQPITKDIIIFLKGKFFNFISYIFPTKNVQVLKTVKPRLVQETNHFPGYILGSYRLPF